MNKLTEEDIRARLLKSSQVTPHPRWIEKIQAQAAVLVPLTHFENKWHAVFIKRAEHENDIHSGQIAFPGGRSESQDKTLIDTALREAEEEIGIAPQDIKMLGYLNDAFSISQYRVTPIVGILPWPYHFQLQQTEVSNVINIPLEWLADQNNVRVETRLLGEKGTSVQVHYYDAYQGEILWGFTARVMIELIKRLTF